MAIQQLPAKPPAARTSAWSRLDDPNSPPVTARAYVITLGLTATTVISLCELYLLVMP
ncbi:hypothetical protein [Nocardia asteroides]|uniref:hypothetical protein n=1 Tax=Nocardia asteroides TaxID=1824 RepID=UPI001E623C35|nr:hypothetical protein [Nocardia asteroides]UGT58832.1 hypothetical protein LTT85_33310 [Nocardia asteroides]